MKTITLSLLLMLSTLSAFGMYRFNPMKEINDGLDAIAKIEEIEKKGLAYRNANIGLWQKHQSDLKTVLWNLGFENQVSFEWQPSEIFPNAKRILPQLKSRLNNSQ